ncbi:polyphosphate kinase 2 family protein [bacterium]|nr:polyphosphate kinase 2 family protein [bacterium]
MEKEHPEFLNDPRIVVKDGANFQLSEHSCSYTGGLDSEKEAKKRLKKANKKMFDLQNKLYANDNHSILLVFQAMDAAGKDSTIRAVFSGINPTGFQVSSFKAPSKEELDHDFLWRCQKALPERGRIGIFNRSHYEEVLVCKVHPEYILGQRIPGIQKPEDITQFFWTNRYESIVNWEKHLVQSGTIVLKFFLNVSKEEQKKRFMSRIETQGKNWKFSFGDMKERALWAKYMDAYEQAIRHTAQPEAPWFVIPADDKDVMRAMVAEIVCETLERLDLAYPNVGAKEIEEMKEAEKILKNEE